MSKYYRFIFDPTSAKHICPDCGKKKFVRYIDIITHQYLPIKYGRCDRSGHYFYNPYTDGYAKEVNGIESYQKHLKEPNKEITPEPLVYIPQHVLVTSIQKGYEENNFIQNLLKRIPFPFSKEDVDKVIALYFLGTINKGKLKGAVTFPYFERIDQIQAMQIVQYGPDNRRKIINWIDTYISPLAHNSVPVEFPAVQKKRKLYDWIEARRNQSKVNCFFGAHLISLYPKHRIALVESPKAAILGMLYFGFPQDHPDNFIWVATGSKDYFTEARSKIFTSREVIVFADLSANGETFKQWEKKSVDLQEHLKDTIFKMYSFFEKNASFSEKHEGLDIADYIVKYDWRKFRSRHLQENSNQVLKDENSKIEQLTTKLKENTEENSTEHKVTLEAISLPKSISHLAVKDQDKIKLLLSKRYILDPNQTPLFFKIKSTGKDTTHGLWDQEIQSLETFFKTAKVPEKPFHLNVFTPVGNVWKFIEYNLEVAKANNGNHTYRPYLNRLIDLMKYLSN